MSNDLYNYHLQFLVKKDLVPKEGARYRLTLQGKQYVAEINPINPIGRKADLFKLNVLILVYKTSTKGIEILSQVRKRQAFYNRRGIMGGTIRKGEPVLRAAKRKLKEETGLEANFSLLGVVRKVDINENEIFSDIVFFICVASEPQGVLSPRTQCGENSWVSLSQAIIDQKKSTPTKELLPLLRTLRLKKKINSDIFFREEIQEIQDF